MKTAKAAQADAAALAAGEAEAFRADYPTRLEFPYRLEDKARKWPFLVEGMWHDGRFTYLRSSAQESPALYELKDGKPALVAYDLGRGRAVYRPASVGRRLVADRQTKSQVAARAPGERAVSIWRRLYPKPAGSLPGGMVTQWGVGITILLVLGFLTAWIYLGGDGATAVAPGTEPDPQAPRSFADRMAARVAEEDQREQQRRIAAVRDAERSLAQLPAATGGIAGGRVSAMDAMRAAGDSEDTGQPYSEEEWKLRERLRLEEIERRRRSLRSAPVAHSYRQADGRAAGADPAQGTEDDAPAASAQTRNDAALERALDSFGQATASLEAEAKAAEAALLQGNTAPTAPPGGRGSNRWAGSKRHRRGITPNRRESARLKIRPAGNGSMRARFWRPRW